MSGSGKKLQLSEIILEIFQNQRTVENKNTERFFTYSHVKLSHVQAQELKYPEGFHPLGVFLIEQRRTIAGDSNIVESQTLISFAKKKHDDFIYGLYYDISNQKNIPFEDLTCQRHAITLDETAIFTLDETYIETYNDVHGISVFTGYSLGILAASLGYAYHCKFYYEILTLDGIQNSNEPVTEVTGPSKNLKELSDIDCRICKGD